MHEMYLLALALMLISTVICCFLPEIPLCASTVDAEHPAEAYSDLI